MSDADDAVAKAIALTRRLAATMSARKDELAAELAQRKVDRAGLDALPASAETLALQSDLDARIAGLTTQLGAVDHDLKAALAELANLGRLGADARVAAARAVVAGATAEPDPIIRSAEEIALDNARAHIADLDAQARVNDAFADTAPIPRPPAETRKPTREEADAQALAEFQALRNKPKKTF